MKKSRLDQLVLERGLAETRSKARALILAGEILVGGKKGVKAGEMVSVETLITLAHPGPKYVSRGGNKLAGALDDFQIDPKTFRCLDIGASTGGFTDCLLQRGAAHVFAIDVGTGQFDWQLSKDSRVTINESFHVRDLKPSMLDPVDLAVVDVSFISLTKVLPFAIPCIRSSGKLLALIKPQFEATKKEVGKGGVVRDEGKRQEIIEKMTTYASQELGLQQVKTADSKLPGPKGNREIFLLGTIA